MNRNSMRATGTTSLVFTTLIAACGGGNSPPQEQPGTASSMVMAAQGGTLTLGNASLNVPAGALAANTTLTVTSMAPPATLPEQATLKGLVYQMGPAGTQFAMPATLSLPSPGTPPAGKQAVISQMSMGQTAWTNLATTAAGGKLTAQVRHFSYFIVRFVDAAGSSGTVDCSFNPCGGNPAGAWRIDGFCGSFGEESQNPFAQSCPSATFDVTVQATGTINFGAGNAYAASLTFGGRSTYSLPATCLPPGVTECAQLGAGQGSGAAPTATCTGTTATACTCTSNNTGETAMDSGTWAVSGNRITVTDTDGKVDTVEFCVQGNRMKLRSVPEPGSSDPPIVFVLTRQ